jgi:restriction system protein
MVNKTQRPLNRLLNATVAFFRGNRHDSPQADADTDNSHSYPTGLTWEEFQLLVSEAFRLQGHGVTFVGGYSDDDGVEMMLNTNDQTCLVQCKLWKASSVDVEDVHELYRAMTTNLANAGFMVSFGRFTSTARAFAVQRNIHLIEGPELVDMIRQAKLSIIRNAEIGIRAPTHRETY